MELKDYQGKVIERVGRYLGTLRDKREEAEEYAEFQGSRGKDAEPRNYCADAWEQLNAEGYLPVLRNRQGEPTAAPYVDRRDGLIVRSRMCASKCRPREARRFSPPGNRAHRDRLSSQADRLRALGRAERRYLPPDLEEPREPGASVSTAPRARIRRPGQAARKGRSFHAKGR